MTRKRPRLTPEWRRAWRWLSVQVAAVATVYGLLPIDQQRAILELLHVPAERITAVIGLAFLVARLLAQPAAK